MEDVVQFGYVLNGQLVVSLLAFTKGYVVVVGTIDDVLLESLKKPLGYIPMTVALYFIAVYLPLTGMADTFATNLIKAMIAFTIFSALANGIAPIFQAFTSSAVLTRSMTMWLERAARIIIWIIGLTIDSPRLRS